MKIILYIATSIDGYIADQNGNVDWLPQPTEVAEDFGYESLLERIKIIIMGSKSYEQILTFGDWTWKDKETYVFSSKSSKAPCDNIFFEHSMAADFITKLKLAKPEKDVWLLGGAQLIKSFANDKLIDECVITVIPTKLGQGISLELPYEDFKLLRCQKFKSEIVQNFYEKQIIGNYS
jgi:dihydrofolate reductase